MKRRRRSTPAGEHRAVLLDEVLAALDPQSGQAVVDCTLGWAGHAAELLRRVGPTGRLLGLDLDADNLPKARERLESVGHPFSVYHGNFAGVALLLAQEGLRRIDRLVADLGMSSMQVDDQARGFSYRRDGPLDMRMDRSRGRTAARLLATLPEAGLAQALRELGDEPEADRIAAAIVAARGQRPIETTADLVAVVTEATQPPGRAKPWQLHPSKGRWNLHPAARTFQALRILVNRELANLQNLLRVLPELLAPGGRAAIITFHSGEDRLVKSSFREGKQRGLYARAAEEPIRPTWQEREANPRARSAKLRWAEKTGERGA
jgi:16S rRNA (cytosine1402-N4)-methyltransferase